MGQFIKYTLASCLGVFIAFFLVILIFFGIIGVMVSAGGQQQVAVKKNSILKIALEGTPPERTNNVAETSFSFEQSDVLGIHEIMRLIEHAAEDENIDGIYLDPTNTYLGLATSKEFINSLKKFRESGKFICSYAPYYSQGPYYLASASDAIYLNPIGQVDFRGFASMVPFFKEMLDKTGIKMEIFYAGDFKSATEPFRRNDMSEENKLQIRELLEDTYTEYLEEIAVNRGLTSDALYTIADELRSNDADAAIGLGLVDQIGHEYDAMNWIRERMGKDPEAKLEIISMYDYYLSDPLPYKSAKKRIAVVYAEGSIVSGDLEYGTITDGRYVEIFDDLRDEEDIVGTVLRVNSPGGSILASENILKAIQRYKESGKNLIVSMGDYAASGGYYISVDADKIFAEPSTITGSIGVFSMIPNVSDLMNNKLGIHFDTVTTATYSASFTPLLDWSDPEKAHMQQRTDAFYQLFLQKVSDGRDMTVEEVHKIAQGRVWSGNDALANGLVDALGDLDDAVRESASQAGVEEYKISEYPKTLNPLNKLIAEISGQDAQSKTREMISQLEPLFPGVSQTYELIQWNEPVARLPYIFQFH